MNVIRSRWALLGGAFVCGVLFFALPLVAPLRSLFPQGASDWVMSVVTLFAAAMQWLGARALNAHLRSLGAEARATTFASTAASICWLLTALFGFWATASGPAGIVPGLLLMLPAAMAALVLQVVALIGFGNSERKATAAKA